MRMVRARVGRAQDDDDANNEKKQGTPFPPGKLTMKDHHRKESVDENLELHQHVEDGRVEVLQSHIGQVVLREIQRSRNGESRGSVQ